MDEIKQHGNTMITPALCLLMAIGGGIALVAVCIIVVMRLKYAHKYSGTTVRTSYTGTHIPLTKTQSNNPDVIPTNKGELAESSK